MRMPSRKRKGLAEVNCIPIPPPPPIVVEDDVNGVDELGKMLNKLTVILAQNLEQEIQEGRASGNIQSAFPFEPPADS